MKDMSSVTNYLDMDNKELFNIYSQDKSNKEVRDILIERNLYLVNILAKKYINKGVEFIPSRFISSYICYRTLRYVKRL